MIAKRDKWQDLEGAKQRENVIKFLFYKSNIFKFQLAM